LVVEGLRGQHLQPLVVLAQTLYFLLSHLMVAVAAVLAAHLIEMVQMAVLEVVRVAQAEQPLVLVTHHQLIHRKVMMVELLALVTVLALVGVVLVQ
jgi:hypothetical protein